MRQSQCVDTVSLIAGGFGHLSGDSTMKRPVTVGDSENLKRFAIQFLRKNSDTKPLPSWFQQEGIANPAPACVDMAGQSTTCDTAKDMCMSVGFCEAKATGIFVSNTAATKPALPRRNEAVVLSRLPAFPSIEFQAGIAGKKSNHFNEEDAVFLYKKGLGTVAGSSYMEIMKKALGITSAEIDASQLMVD